MGGMAVHELTPTVGLQIGALFGALLLGVEIEGFVHEVVGPHGGVVGKMAQEGGSEGLEFGVEGSGKEEHDAEPVALSGGYHMVEGLEDASAVADDVGGGAVVVEMADGVGIHHIDAHAEAVDPGGAMGEQPEMVVELVGRGGRRGGSYALGHLVVAHGDGLDGVGADVPVDLIVHHDGKPETVVDHKMAVLDIDIAWGLRMARGVVEDERRLALAGQEGQQEEGQ